MMPGPVQALIRAFRELRRRHVIQVAIVYGAAAWVVIEVAETTFPHLGLPDPAVTLVIAIAALGFPLALVLAWAFELTPQGVRAVTDDDEARSPTAPSAAVPTDQAEPAASLDPHRDTLLVLPFDNVSPDPENDYFSDGLTEEIITDLSHIRSLGVISRTSAMRLKDADKDVPTLGRELGVRYVLEGSVRKSGDRVRITAQLIDARSDEHLWAEKYGGRVEQVFEIQERVAAAIARALRIQLSPVERKRLGERRIEDPRAVESYLRARHDMWSFSEERLDKALRHIQNALDIVGDNELLLLTRGQIHITFLQAGVRPDPEHLEIAEECAEAIFRLSPDSHHGHRLKGFIEFQRGNLREARPHLEAALDRDPDDPDTLIMLGYLYCLAGRERWASPLFERALAIDPLTPLNHGLPGFVAWVEGRFEDAVEPYRTFLQMDGGPFSMAVWVWVLGLNNRIEEAEPVVQTLVEKHPGSPLTSLAESLFHGLQGEPEAALEAISPEFREAGRRSEMFSRALAECHAVAGDNDGAMEWLEHAVRLGLINYPYLSRIDPLLEGLRDDPRFLRLMERVKREWREFEPGPNPGPTHP